MVRRSLLNLRSCEKFTSAPLFLPFYSLATLYFTALPIVSVRKR